MEDDNLSNKITILEKRITHLENEKDEDVGENSVISLLLDIFNFKKFLETIFHSQNKIVFTHNFINIVLLFLFLLFIFWQSEVLNFSKTPATIALGFIVIAGFFEVLGANTSLFKNFFVKDAKTKTFFDKISSLSAYQIDNFLKNQTFSVECLNHFIMSLNDKDRYPPSVVYSVIDTQKIRTENLDLLLSPTIIKNLNQKLIIRLLFKCSNFLKYSHIENIYQNFHENEDVIKILFATQKYSDCLLNLDPDNHKLKEYFNKYQIEKKHTNWFLETYPNYNTSLVLLPMWSFFSLVFFALITVINSYTSNDNIISVTAFGAVLLGFGVTAFLFNPVLHYLNKSYRIYYAKSVLKI